MRSVPTSNEVDRSLTQATALVNTISYVTNRSKKDNQLGLKIGAACWAI